MATAGGAFTHTIAERLSGHHRLVMHGIYRYVRHPGYLGWFIWVLGTQVLLQNAVSLVLFAFVTWRFFAQRIRYEEARLRDPRFFGEAYAQYARRTRTWIPGIP
jgi:protein-S-isoprenylcysteine O-methyltransferase